MRRKTPLFDDLIGALLELRRYVEAKCLRRLKAEFMSGQQDMSMSLRCWLCNPLWPKP
jgi:hypothetical protein